MEPDGDGNPQSGLFRLIPASGLLILPSLYFLRSIPPDPAQSRLTGCHLLFVSCAAAGTGLAENKTVHIVTTVFPIYDWVREIVGSDMDHVNLNLHLVDAELLPDPAQGTSSVRPAVSRS